MKIINIYLEEKEHSDLVKIKKDMTWRDVFNLGVEEIKRG